MKSKYSIICQSCKTQFKKWEYEITAIKNIATYVCKSCKSKNCRTTKECPVCNKNFTSFIKENKTTCSYACSNRYFRTGPNNGNWKVSNYRSTCFNAHKKECVVCRENKIVEVHHYDHNHDNNNTENLIPLCPTHHRYMHSRHAKEIIDVVKKYHEKFISKHLNKNFIVV